MHLGMDNFCKESFRKFVQVIVVLPNVTDLTCLELFASRAIPEVEQMLVAGQ